MARSTTVSADLRLRLIVPGSASLPVRAAMRYDVADPYAVQVAFQTGLQDDSEVVPWTFARALLSDGTTGAAGEGDVRVWPEDSADGHVVCLSLSSPSGKALFEVPLTDLVEFLARTYDAVPTGCESDHVDVDAELALLLWAEPE